MAQPIHTNTIDKWKNGLNEHQIRIAEVICGKHGKFHGYEPTTHWNPMQWISIHCIAFFAKGYVYALLIKDGIFNRLPIHLKVNYFVNWVAKIDQKRKKNVDTRTA